MSLNRMPAAREVRDVADQRPQVGLGHFAMRRRSRTSSRCLRCEATAARFSSASTASLRRSGLRERRDGARICCSSAGLALGRGLEDAQVAPRHAVARQLGDRADDLALGLVVVAHVAAQLAGDDPVVLELGHEPPLGAGLLDARPRASTARPCRAARRSAAAAPRPAARRSPPAARRPARRPRCGPRPAPGGSPAAAGTRRAAAAGSCAGARRRSGSTGGSRRACAAASAASGPPGSGSWRSRCPGTPAAAPCRPRRWSATSGAGRARAGSRRRRPRPGRCWCPGSLRHVSGRRRSA